MKQYSMATIGTSHTMPIPYNGYNTYVNFEKLYFNDPLAYFTTSDEKLQEAIEASKFFKSKEIRITGVIEAVEDEAAELAELKAKEEADKAAAELAEQKAKEEADKAAAELAEQKAKEEADKTAEAPAERVKESVEEAKAPEAPKAIVNDEVTKFQDAKKILTSEPYKVPFQALSTPEKILIKAAELGITFTNLHLPE